MNQDTIRRLTINRQEKRMSPLDRLSEALTSAGRALQAERDWLRGTELECSRLRKINIELTGARDAARDHNEALQVQLCQALQVLSHLADDASRTELRRRTSYTAARTLLGKHGFLWEKESSR